jgi:hypothetical protein
MASNAAAKKTPNAIADDWSSAAPVLTPEEQALLARFNETEELRAEGKLDQIAALEAELGEGGGTGMAPGSKRPAGVWTLDSLEEPLPTATGDLYGDGRFLFTFHPDVMGRTDVQKTFRKVERLSLKSGRDMYELSSSYASVLYECLKGCSWPLQEEVEDPDTGELVLDENGLPTLRPLPITLRNCEKLRTETAVKFFLAMQKSITGEASGQGSPTA